MIAKQFKNKIKLCKRYLPKNMKVVFVAFFGSWNYGLQTETSDVDMKVVYVPTLDDLINRVEEIETVKVDCGLVDKIALPAYIKKLSELELPYLEVLMCRHIWINPNYTELVENMRSVVKEALLKNKRMYAENVFKTIRTIYGNFVNGLFDYNGKKAYNILRLNLLLRDVLERDDYKLVVADEYKERILQYKTGVVKRDEARVECKNIIDDVERLKNDYNNDYTYHFEVILKEMCKDVIKRNIEAEDEVDEPVVEENHQEEVMTMKKDCSHIVSVSIMGIGLLFFLLVVYLFSQ